MLIYDIENDRLRTRASDICLDYGLERIQYSAFFGKLNRNRRHLSGQLGRQQLACSERRRDAQALVPGCEPHRLIE